MAHANQERYSALVDAKLRATLVTRDGAIFNTRYEGSPKAGKVKIPVRDTEVAVKAYDKANGVDLLAAQLAVGAAPGAQSVSNDGYAVTFAANTSLSAAVRFEAWHVLEAALGSDPHGLLYRGIM